jgi:hypothetical protein
MFTAYQICTVAPFVASVTLIPSVHVLPLSSVTSPVADALSNLTHAVPQFPGSDP